MIKGLNVRLYSLVTLIRVLTNIIHEGSTLLTSVQSLSRVRLFVTLWTAARQPSLSTTNSRSLLKFMSMIPSNHPLSSPSPPAFNLSQHQGLFKWVSSSHQMAKVLEFQLQHQSFSPDLI